MALGGGGGRGTWGWKGEGHCDPNRPRDIYTTEMTSTTIAALDGLENAPAAFRGLLEGRNFGKLIVRVGDDPTV